MSGYDILAQVAKAAKQSYRLALAGGSGGFSLSLFFRRKVTKRSAKSEGSARTLQAHARGQ
jgi:hypothetical protein